MRRIAATLLLGLGALTASYAARAADITRVCNQVVNSVGNISCQDSFSPSLLSALSGTVASIKSSNPGVLGFLSCINPNTTAAYIQVFDAATSASVTLGTTVPVMSFGIVPSSSTPSLMLSPIGVEFRNGIQIGATTTPLGSTSPSTALTCNAGFD